MILSDNEIRKYADQVDSPLITPFSEEQLQGASYDLSMSHYIAVMKRTGQVIDSSAADDVSKIYERKFIGESGYILAPGEFILVEVTEKISLPENLIAHIRPRTRFTRSGILIADQHCNPTYEGILQLGLYNLGSNAFLLKPGLQIAQMVFEELTSIPSKDKLYKNKANAAYMGEQEFRGAVYGEASWSEAGRQFYHDLLNSLGEE